MFVFLSFLAGSWLVLNFPLSTANVGKEGRKEGTHIIVDYNVKDLQFHILTAVQKV